MDFAGGITPTANLQHLQVERIKDNAKTMNTSIKEETLRVIFHGALHLCGYKDKSKADIIKMRMKEDYYLSLYKSSLGQ